MEWRTATVMAELGPLVLYISSVSPEHWSCSAHLVIGEGDDEVRACVVGGGHRRMGLPSALSSLAEAQAALQAYAARLGPVEPVLALLAFFRFDRDRPTARRLATGRATLRKARKRRAA